MDDWLKRPDGALLTSLVRLDHGGGSFFLAGYHEDEGIPPLDVYSIPEALALIGNHFLNEEGRRDLRQG